MTRRIVIVKGQSDDLAQEGHVLLRRRPLRACHSHLVEQFARADAQDHTVRIGHAECAKFLRDKRRLV